MFWYCDKIKKYRKKILPSGPIRIGIEAGVETGWHKWLSGERGKSSKACFIVMKGFGASGPVDKIFDHFKINSQAICDHVEKLVWFNLCMKIQALNLTRVYLRILSLKL